MRVALLATGKTELFGLPDALTRLFPGHSFDAVWELPGQRPYWSFTSNRLPSPPAPAPPALDKLVEEAAARVDPRFPGRDDFVVLLDDLELVNQGYLQWLMQDGSSKRCTSYDEVNNGAEALRQIDWAELLKYRKRNTYARALIADLSDALEQAPTIPNWQGDEADLTSRLTLRASHYLRNI